MSNIKMALNLKEGNKMPEKTLKTWVHWERIIALLAKHNQTTISGFLFNKKGAKYKGGKNCQKKRENVESNTWQNCNNNDDNDFQRSAVMQSQGAEGSFGNKYCKVSAAIMNDHG